MSGLTINNYIRHCLSLLQCIVIIIIHYNNIGSPVLFLTLLNFALLWLHDSSSSSAVHCYYSVVSLIDPTKTCPNQFIFLFERKFLKICLAIKNNSKSTINF